MKALSILQPWAWLIVHGHKNIENRTWWTSYRGPILIHAGKRFAREQMYDAANVKEEFPHIPLPPLTDHGDQGYRLGGFIGTAEIVDCVKDHKSPWFNGPYGFVIRNARPIPFVPYRGELGIFEVPDSALQLPTERDLLA